MKKTVTLFFLLLFCTTVAFAEDFDPAFEGYVLTHVKKEMSPNWPLEALKAQAVLARTFEMKAGHGNMTVEADFTEMSNPVRSVAETAGLVLKYNGELASVFYHADSGGVCSTAEAVWGGKNLPYLVFKKDAFATQSPNQLWQKEISATDFESMLLANGIAVGTPIAFSNIVRDESGRVKNLDIVGMLGSVNISGGKLRTVAGLKSTLVNFGNQAPDGSICPVAAPMVKSRTVVLYGTSPVKPKRKIDRSKMPQGKQDRLLWFADNGIISVEQLMAMLAKPENIDVQLAFCMKRLDAVAPLAKDIPKADATVPTTESESHVVKPESVITAQTSNLPTEYKIEGTIQFTGRGWGHGVGMSQWQAKAMADNGWTYMQILEYYFPGLTLEHY